MNNPGSVGNIQVLDKLRGRVASLDGLRAISIAMVLFSHAEHGCGFPEVPTWSTWLFNGSLGVRIFFVISGFIITLLLLREEGVNGTFSIGKFYVRRIFRILPVYYLFLITVMIINRYADLDITSRDLLHAFTFTTGWWMGEGWMLGHTWSLSVEEQFYLLWPAMLLLVRQPKHRVMLILGCLALYPVMRVLVYVSPLADRRSYLFITQGDAILFGCLLAILLFYYGATMMRYLTQKVTLSQIVCVLLIGLSNAIQSKAMLGMITVPLSNTIEAAAIAWLIGSLIFNKTWVHRVLNTKAFIFVGTVSYSWYLWQQLFLFDCGKYFPGFVFNFPVNIAVSFIVAVASYYLIERTFERLKKNLMKVSATDAA